MMRSLYSADVTPVQSGPVPVGPVPVVEDEKYKDLFIIEDEKMLIIEYEK